MDSGRIETDCRVKKMNRILKFVNASVHFQNVDAEVQIEEVQQRPYKDVEYK